MPLAFFMQRFIAILDGEVLSSREGALLRFTRLVELEMDAELQGAPEAFRRIVSRARHMADKIAGRLQ